MARSEIWEENIGLLAIPRLCLWLCKISFSTQVDAIMRRDRGRGRKKCFCFSKMFYCISQV